MPTVKDKLGNVISKLPYTEEGISEAESIVSQNPDFMLERDYAPAGTYDAGGRVKKIMGYGDGGKVKK